MAKTRFLSLCEKRFSNHLKPLTLLALGLAVTAFSASVALADTSRTLTGPSGSIHSVAVSPDGQTIAAASGGATVHLWDASTGKVMSILKGHTGPVRSVAFSPDGQSLVTGGSDNTVRIWERDSGRNTAILKGHEGTVHAVAFSPDGKTIASASGDTTLKLWDVSAQTELRTLEGHFDEVTSLAFSPNGKYILSGSLDESLRIWEVSTGKEDLVLQIPAAEGNDGFIPIVAVSSVAFSPDGRSVLSGSDDHHVRQWVLGGDSSPRMLKGHAYAVNGVAFSLDGKFILSGSKGSLKLWNAENGKVVQSWSAHVTSLAFTPDQRFAVTGDTEGNVKLWDIASFVKPMAVAQSKLKSKPTPKIKKKSQLPPVTKPPVSTPKQDTQPPTLIITSHDVNRGIITVPDVPEAFVSGKATDPSGVDEVTVNGDPAVIDPSGNFTADVPLQPGKNKIEVMARDNVGNVAWKKFWVEGKESTPPPMVQPKVAASDGKFHALIIGINNYESLPDLQTAVHDAREVDKILREKYGFTTTLLIDPGREGIMDGFNKIRTELGPKDNLLIYYAGHGEFDASVNKAYWLPSDAQPDSDTKWIIVDNITSNIKRMAAKHVLVVADSCYSGTLTRSAITRLRGAKEKQRFLAKMKKRNSRTLMASGGNEPVSDSGGEGHSIFARAFINALSNPDHKEFTAEQLFYDQIKERVAGSAEQVPEYNIIKNSGHEGGDFVFIQK